MQSEADPVDAFLVAAITWAAGGRGQPLVDAAAQALAHGLDSPTLRILAGAPRASAEEEASLLAPRVFEELGLTVAPRLSPRAVVDSARHQARRFLAGDATARALARELSRMSVAADDPSELADFSRLDDWYDLLEHGVIQGHREDADAATREAAQRLVQRRPPQGVPLDQLFVAAPPDPAEPAG